MIVGSYEIHDVDFVGGKAKLRAGDSSVIDSACGFSGRAAKFID